MTRVQKKYIGALAVIVILALAFVALRSSSAFVAPAKTSPPLKITWLIAHEPISLFDRADKVFVDEFNKDSDGTIEIQILGPKDFGSTTGHLSNSDVFQALDSGQVQLATTVTTGLAYKSDPELGVLALPFLFKNPSTAGQVLDGPIGDSLLSTIDASTTAHGLAFTFSGGLMVIESDNKEIHSVDDLKGMRIGTINGPVAIKTLDALGATAVALDPGKGTPAINKLLATFDGIETPYTRISTQSTSTLPRYVNETDHSFFLTAILASDSFYNSLSAQNKDALLKAARAAAVAEREDSIALAAKNRATLQQKGTIIVTMSPDATAAFKAKAIGVYQQLVPVFGEDMVQNILNAQN